MYRKTLCLQEMGRLREAYECGTACLLIAPHVRGQGWSRGAEFTSQSGHVLFLKEADP